MQSLRFDVLHGIRGVAALFVVIHHTNAATGLHPTPGAYLAVDLFFLLSGFVIAHSYEPRLRSGLSFGSFARARMVRLYPLYALSLLIVAAFLGTKYLSGDPDAPDFFATAASMLLSFLFLPTPPQISMSPAHIFPLNIPSWSLFFEIIANFVFAILVPFLSTLRLKILIGLCLVWLIAGAFAFGTFDGGYAWDTIWMGFPRVLFSFFLGVYLRRRWEQKPDGQALGAWFVLALMVVIAAVMVFHPMGASAVLFDLVVASLIWPIVLLVAVRISISGVLKDICHWLGEASYSAYVLHIPLLIWTVPLAERLFRWTRGEFPVSFVVAFVILVAVASILAHRFFDTPVRRVLNRALTVRQTREAVTQF